MSRPSPPPAAPTRPSDHRFPLIWKGRPAHSPRSLCICRHPQGRSGSHRQWPALPHGPFPSAWKSLAWASPCPVLDPGVGVPGGDAESFSGGPGARPWGLWDPEPLCVGGNTESGTRLSQTPCFAPRGGSPGLSQEPSPPPRAQPRQEGYSERRKGGVCLEEEGRPPRTRAW